MPFRTTTRSAPALNVVAVTNVDRAARCVVVRTSVVNSQMMVDGRVDVLWTQLVVNRMLALRVGCSQDTAHGFPTARDENRHGVRPVVASPVQFSVAVAFAIVAFGIYVGTWVVLILVPLFVASITYLQIIPEEIAMQKLFGAAYRSYCHAVRRWI